MNLRRDTENDLGRRTNQRDCQRGRSWLLDNFSSLPSFNISCVVLEVFGDFLESLSFVDFLESFWLGARFNDFEDF